MLHLTFILIFIRSPESTKWNNNHKSAGQEKSHILQWQNSAGFIRWNLAKSLAFVGSRCNGRSKNRGESRKTRNQIDAASRSEEAVTNKKKETQHEEKTS